MNARQRYLAALTFGNPDRIPLMPGVGRLSTLRRWRSEGLPDGEEPLSFVCGELGIDYARDKRDDAFFVNFRMNPVFEERVLAHENGHYIVRDWMGAITEISDQYDYTYIRNAIDFVTRKWHRFPVQSREDWLEMKTRYDPLDPSRLPPGVDAMGAELDARDYVLDISVNGPFWQLREWLGMEGLCVAFLDAPDFVMEMITFWRDFVLALFERFLPYVRVDSVHINEDMAYKAHSMISPAMTRRFLMPVYMQWVEALKRHGVPLIDMDSDGYVEELIPLWIDAGINVCDPIEVAAHNDILKYRDKFGRSMAYTGGIDKRAIARGGDALYNEVMRVAPLAVEGGYIPGCDHGIPHDVSFDNYRAYVRLLAQVTGWL